MERPRIVNTVEFRHHTDMILDPNSRLYHDYKQNDEKVTCFNVATDKGLIRFGYLPSLKGAHSNILFPNIDENPFRGITESSISDNKKTWISLTPTLAGMNLDDEENISAFQGFVTISRFLIESSFSADTNLVGGTTNDLYFLNEASNNAFFRCQIKTLGDLARQALPQDMPPSGINEFRLWRVGDETSRQVEPEEFRKAISAFSGNNALFNICLDNDNSISLGMIISGEDIPYKHLKIRGGVSSARAFSGHVYIDKRKHILTYSASRGYEYIKLGPGFSKHLSDDHIRIARCFIENGFPADIHLSREMSYDIKEVLEITALTISDLARHPLTGETDADK